MIVGYKRGNRSATVTLTQAGYRVSMKNNNRVFRISYHSTKKAALALARRFV
jgi:hypothetical protein